GNFALALAAGPAMVRMLMRYRRRFEFAWKRGPRAPTAKGAAAGAACALAALVIAVPALLPGAPARAAGGGVGSATAWLRGAQNGDGGFGFGKGEDSSPVM